MMMPDITMCTNKECKDRKYCYRQTAEPDERLQAWAHFVPESDGECSHFMYDFLNKVHNKKGAE